MHIQTKITGDWLYVPCYFSFFTIDLLFSHHIYKFKVSGLEYDDFYYFAASVFDECFVLFELFLSNILAKQCPIKIHITIIEI